MYRNNMSHEGRKEQGALAATTATRPSKSNRFMKQNNTLFLHFFAVTARLRRFISRFKENVNTTNFPFLFLDLCAFPEKSAPAKFAYICIFSELE